jgi:hypothetical protein
MKKIATFVLLLLIAMGVAVYLLRENTDELIRKGIVHYGSQVLQTPVGVSQVQLTVADGVGQIKELTIANPAGFQAANLVEAKMIELQLDMRTLTDATVVIRRIELIAPMIRYEKGPEMSNFEALQRNLANTANSKPAQPGKTESAARKLIVEEFIIRDASVTIVIPMLGGKELSVPLPDLQLKDIGKAKGGITAEAFSSEITQALLAQLRASIKIENLIPSTGDALRKIGEGAMRFIQPNPNP